MSLSVSYQSHLEVRHALVAQIQSCNNCDLGKSANRVPFTGVSYAPNLILIGEAPGANEDQAREPFVGKAGQLLDDCLVKAGTSRLSCFITNAVCCRPPGNRNPDPLELKACSQNLSDQINLARSWLGVTLGKIAYQAVSGDLHNPISAVKNKPFWAYGRMWIPTYHPAYALRNPGATSEIIGAIYQAMKFYRGEGPITPDPPGNWWIEDGWVVTKNESVRLNKAILDTVKGHFPAVEWAKVRFLDEEGRLGAWNMRNAFSTEIT